MARMRPRRRASDADDEFAAAVESRLAPAEESEIANDEERVPLGRLLVEREALSEDQVVGALTTQTETGKRLGEILLEGGLLSEAALAEVLAEQLGLETVDLEREKIERSAVELLAAPDARRLGALPLRREGERVVVAVADPVIPDLTKDLIGLVKAPVRIVVAANTAVFDAIGRSYSDVGEIGDAVRDFAERFAERRRAVDTGGTVAVDENAPVVRVVNLIFERAVRDRASDVHIEPQENRVRVRVRTDGALHEVMSLPASMGVPLVSRIKVMAEMNIVERRRPQDGQLEVSVEGRELDVRVSTTATVWGEKCVMRLLERNRAFLDLAELGMVDETLAVYSGLIRSPFGMIICAGPTGSGKTTTLYATLAAVDSDERNVVTIEDPVEYLFAGINQIQINEAAGITFANGLRSILRQDPDAILVGEIRDVETARIAVQAALTGHLVMSSLHATDAASALHRFMDMGIEPFLIASSLLAVVGQRLLRKVCSRCTEPYTPSPDELAFFERSGGRADKAEFVHGAGCTTCGYTGYFGRVGVYEVLTVTDPMRDFIVSNASLGDLRDQAVADGMRTLRQQAVGLVERDHTTISEVLRTIYIL